MLITEINPIQRSPNQPGHHKNGGQLASGASCPAHARRSHCSRTAGRDRVATRGRGICLPSVLLPPSAPTSYHKKVTSVAKEQRGIRGFSFRERNMSEAWFPRRIPLGSSVNKSPADAHVPSGWHHGRWVSIARRISSRRISSYAHDDRTP